MKKLLFIMAALAFGLFAYAQIPPQKVADNFAKKFPNATKVKWDQEEENEWEAEFKQNGSELSACFDQEGKWFETEKEVGEKDLPDAVLKAIKQKYSDYKIEEASLIETLDFSGYEVALELKENEVEVQVTMEGILSVKKETRGED
ncbi:hypothetical protein MNBD_BACTEROID01-2880 [hydrothermal vent metagenome]|uniref:Putative beta-lactamase-inhibitor-like PepSY-like domain-containing protein n=1 Tax=hydrothermal vent metagenome TaxID=652676 RepID=A0A3B0UHI3_9ZZZZ